ncbi:MAG TPA: sulfatase-like hydrolase/transferase, partial [bacterium]|nr:sulfatase-like hydrolase/transferase [bacterium]
MTGCRRAARVLLSVGPLLLSGCGPSPTETLPGVLFVSIDTLRPDHLGAYGHPEARTPHLDALARRSALFTEARVPYPLTLPSHSSMMTGRTPYRHGARRNDSFALDPELPTLAGEFGRAGYATGAVVSTFVLNRNFGLAAPFGTYLDLADAGPVQSDLNERRAGETTRLSAEWLGARPDSSFFFWTHYFDPHDDYLPPPPWNRVFGEGEIRQYDGEVAYTDQHFGELLRAVRARQRGGDVLVVVTSDHGEAFGEQGEFGHGFFLYDVTVRVPLLIGRARGGEPSIHDEYVSTLDLFPTVCRLAGLPVPEGMPGRFLDPFGSGPHGNRPLYLETFEPTVAYGATDLRAVVDDGWKWIEAPTPELYELVTDPHELENLEGAEPDREGPLRDELARHLEAEQTVAARADRGAVAAVDDATRARLRALGYLSSEEDADHTWSRRDPKEIVHLLPKMFRGIRHCLDGEMEEGLALLGEVLEEDPVNSKALHWLSEDRILEEDWDGALDLYRTALEYDPENVGLRSQLGVVALRARRPDEAIAALREVVRQDPDHVAGWLNLASAELQARHPRNAVHAVRRALEIDPWNPMA